ADMGGQHRADQHFADQSHRGRDRPHGQQHLAELPLPRVPGRGAAAQSRMAGSAIRMLTSRQAVGRARERGVVLMVALIVLVAMTLAGIALMRSVDTTTLIAGNLAFQQSATNGGDIGTETAIAWLEANNSGTTLYSSYDAQGYQAKRQDPAGDVT